MAMASKTTSLLVASKTIAGEIFETAMICVQREAPVDSNKQFRLGSEISRIYETPFALPVAVRKASSRAREIRMSFLPTLIAMPDGRRFVLNGRTSFMAVEGYNAEEAKVASGNYFEQKPLPAFVEKPKDLVYFVVDGEPGWIAEEAASFSEVPQRRSWLQKLLDWRR